MICTTVFGRLLKLAVKECDRFFGQPVLIETLCCYCCFQTYYIISSPVQLDISGMSDMATIQNVHGQRQEERTVKQ